MLVKDKKLDELYNELDHKLRVYIARVSVLKRMTASLYIEFINKTQKES